MKIVYIPMDERPCNYKFPALITSGNPAITLQRPATELLGNKKKPADIDGMWAFFKAAAATADYAVISLDMLYYGGLIPSRLHHESAATLQSRIAALEAIHTAYPNLHIVAYESIMRSPSHDTAEEEPDYYGQYGLALHRRAALQDKQAREALTEQEAAELAGYQIPATIIADYEDRRAVNMEMNIETLKLLERGVIDFLVFPQDDSAPYGYTAISQQAVLKAIQEYGLEGLTRIYPGSDEVGCSLVARAYLEETGKSISVYPYYASVLGPTLVPLYEDRPMLESLKSHLEVCGLHYATSLAEADCLLAINSPGKVMIEAPAQENSDVTYATYRNLTAYLALIKDALKAGKQVAICDSAYTNGGDLTLFNRLMQEHLSNEVCAYAGWNTNCNTLGTTLGALIFNYDLPVAERQAQLVYRYVEDVLYQADVRQVVLNDYLPSFGGSYFDLKGQDTRVCDQIKQLLNARIAQYPALGPVTVTRVTLPWRRMFELDMTLATK